MSTRLLAVVAMLGSMMASVEGAQPADAQVRCNASLGAGGAYAVACPALEPGGGGGGDGEGGGNGGGEVPRCVWRLWETDGGELGDLWHTTHPSAPDDAYWYWYTCSDVPCPTPDTWSGGVCGPFDVYTTWSDPWEIEIGEAVELALLRILWAEIQGQLTSPEVVQYPSEDDPAIVQIPTFVAVENPQQTINAGPECAPTPAGNPCLTVEAEPTLWFDPGDGEDPLSCDPEGTPFDPNEDPQTQADRADACAHTYEQHSSDSGYPVQVWTSWDVTWQAAVNGVSVLEGEFDPLELHTDTEPRVVEEVQAVVTDLDV